MRQIPGIYLLENEKGRSVYTGIQISPGDTIEICPIILIPEEQKETIHETIIHDYYFIWPSGGIALALGLGSIYNHSSTPNSEVVFDLENEEIIINCLTAISPGDEIVIDYTGGTREVDLWFDVL